jgi:Matrixin
MPSFGKNVYSSLAIAASTLGMIALSSDAVYAFQLSANGNIGRKWGDPTFGTGATVTYSFMPTGTSCEAIFSGCTVKSLADFMPTAFLSEIRKAFDSWSAIANIKFLEVADDGAAFDRPTNSGDIRLGGRTIDNYIAFGYYPPINSISMAGDIHFESNNSWKIAFDAPGFGYDIFTLAVHEIGHAIGLAHVTNIPSVMYPYYDGMNKGILQADDIAGAQYIYGSRPQEPPKSVPEPATLSLLSGLILLALKPKKPHLSNNS